MNKTKQKPNTYTKEELSTVIKSAPLASPAQLKKVLMDYYGISYSQVKRIYNKYVKPLLSGVPQAVEPKVKVRQNLHDKTVDASVTVDKAVELGDVIKICKIDLNKFSVKSFSVEERANGNYQWVVRCSVNKIGQEIDAFKEIAESIKRDISNNMVAVKAIHPKSLANNELMLELCLPDIHIGRLCWSPSDGDDYDLKIAEKLVFEAVEDMVAKADNFGQYAKICLWIGGDFLNVDNENNTTTASTPQSVDSRFPKVFKKGKDILITVIDNLKQIAPVDVIVTRGNHDSNSLFHMGELLEAYYHKDANVNIENSPAPRKYYRFGQNLIQFSHGDKVGLKKLPSIAAAESPDWSDCKFREIHTAHRHHEELMVSESAGCKTRILNTIAGVDEYHSTHGYVKNLRCVQSFIWDRENGLQAMIYSNPI